MKKITVLIWILAALLALSACSDPVIGAPAGSDGASLDPAAETVITLSGDSASYPGSGVSVQGSVVTIGAPGSYTVRGTLSDGRIIVDMKENPGDVTLILDGADITCLTDSAIYVAQAKNVRLVLASGSENRIVSGTEADLTAYDDTHNGAAIFAEDDLTIEGEGSLEIFGYLNNGVTCKDDLKIKGGVLTVLAANNGLRGSESVTVSGGDITVEAGNDGVKSSSAAKAGKGYVHIEGGKLTVTAGGDGVAAETELTVSAGELKIETTGDPAAASCKGLKGKTGLTISGGAITVLAQDHAIRSQAALSVSGGAIAVRSLQGKGLAAETELTVSGGALAVQSADDGLASPVAVTVSGGELDIISGADGIQGGKKGTGFGTETGDVRIEGGRVLVSAYNKSVDAKASFSVSGGTVFLCGSGSLSAESSVPFLQGSLSGRGGASLRVEGASDAPELTAAYDFSTVFYADASLQAGRSYTLTAGAETVKLTANG